MGRHHGRVALDDDRLALLADRGASELQPVENVRLLVQKRFRRVDVLRRHSIVLEQPTCTEAQHLPSRVANRPHQAALEEVPTRLSCQSGRYQLRVSKAATPQMLQQCAAIPGSKTYLEALCRLAVKTPLVQELSRRDGVGGCQLFSEELSSQPERISHAGSCAVLRPCAGVVGVTQMNAYAVSQPLDCLDEGEVVDLAHEVDHVTALGAGTEAVPVAAGGCHLASWGRA